LIRENRLIAGVHTLEEPKLRQTVLLIKDKVASGATVEDAEILDEVQAAHPRHRGLYLTSLPVPGTALAMYSSTPVAVAWC
jgi:hypothetical protein